MNGKILESTESLKMNPQMQKHILKRSFSRNLTSTVSIANLLMIVQYYNLGDDYFANRDLIIDNVKLNNVNKLVKNLFIITKAFYGGRKP